MKTNTRNKHEIRSRSLIDADFEVRAADGKNTISGYLVRYGQKTSIGDFDEVCMDGMFSRTLRENPDVLLLRDHKSELLIGRTGVNLTLTPDSRGLRFSCTLLDDSANAMQAYADIKSGLLSACSFGFSVPQGGDSWSMQSNNVPLRKLLDVSLFEGSVTSFPAYSATSVNARSMKAKLDGRDEDGIGVDSDADSDADNWNPLSECRCSDDPEDECLGEECPLCSEDRSDEHSGECLRKMTYQQILAWSKARVPGSPSPKDGRAQLLHGIILRKLSLL